MPTSGAGTDWEPDPGGAWPTAPRLARALVVVVFAGLATVPLLRILAEPDPAVRRALGVGCLLAVLLVQLRFLGRPAVAYRGPAGAAALLAETGLAYLPFLDVGRSWAGVPGFLAGSCLLVLPRIAGGVAFAAVVASAAAIQAVLTRDPIEITYATAATATGGLLVYGLTRLAALVEELRDARIEVARMAVAGERLRISRDLHDVLGSSISAITLKSELTARLIRTSPDRAYEEISEVVDISRRALDDVRSVARGYREMSLPEEVLLARSMLTSADVETRVDVSGVEQLPPDVGAVLGMVLREGVTNVLRHSHATRCQVAIRRAGNSVEIEIVNDGVVRPPRDCPERGTGVDSMAARVAGVSGWLTAEEVPGRHWRLFAAIELDATPDVPVGPGGFRDPCSA
jgi:two-component system sensor histidine kinase DesK